MKTLGTRKIIVGTRNKAKVEQIRGALAPLQIEILPLPENIQLPEVTEDGATGQENARKKALAYASALKQPVLSMDNALYFDGLPNKAQPGINVRRINSSNNRPTDAELLAHYTEIVKGLNGKTNARWEFAICLAHSNDNIQETTIISPRIFTAQVSPIVIEGYPLESMQIDPDSGKYISEMTQHEQDIFWQKSIGRQLCQFIQKVL